MSVLTKQITECSPVMCESEEAPTSLKYIQMGMSRAICVLNECSWMTRRLNSGGSDESTGAAAGR